MRENPKLTNAFKASKESSSEESSESSDDSSDSSSTEESNDEEDEEKAMRMKYTDFLKWKKCVKRKEVYSKPKKERHKPRFYGAEKVGGLQLDWALITALVERWRPETHSFHLPFGEVGITLQDVELLLGLPVDGNPLVGMTGRSKDQWFQICEDMIGFRPQTSDITSTMIKMSAIVPKQLTDHSLDVDYLQHARAIMFKLLGGSLFPNTTGNKFVWMSYPNLETLPPYCSAGARIWISTIPLIYAYVVEMYYPDRFCRQFGSLQHVPQVVVYDRHLHQIKSNVMQIGDGERQYSEMWEGRYDATVQMEFGMVDGTPEYRQWYYLRGRRRIGTPVHQHGPGYIPISPELQTALYCMADCSQRLDPGRHPDGISMPTTQDISGDEQIKRRDAPAVGVRRGGRGSRRLQVDDEDVHIPIQSPPMTQDDDDVSDEEHIQSDTHTPSCMGEPSSSHPPRFHIEHPPRRMHDVSPVTFDGDVFRGDFFTQDSQITNEFGQFVSTTTSPVIHQIVDDVEVEGEGEQGLRPRRNRRGTQCGTGSHYL
ncbi:unnamed protein product [Cuscuta campestris]|uniref:Aminotransferase-like plant mobile domain-containing protein n=1 Tax=Cuscuta campestris TaxID=132261 RepID=A0A484MBR7_9ASTE|nr:unnamed protein product [Cuscuta campestris]